jgi:hypothetical protein
MFLYSRSIDVLENHYTRIGRNRTLSPSLGREVSPVSITNSEVLSSNSISNVPTSAASKHANSPRANPCPIHERGPKLRISSYSQKYTV